MKLLKMEKKQLNFDTPLLSVRKSTISASPDGAQNKVVQKSLAIRQHSAPISNSNFELEEVTKTGTVPFVWEQTPGRPKHESTGNIQIPSQASITPRLPPGRPADSVRRSSCDRSNDCYNLKPQMERYPLNDHAALVESLRASLYGNGESDLESVDDDSYSDAVDTFESMSLNCSISGLSDYEIMDSNPSGTFVVDKQTREFMMNRFLPAAKAGIVETPRYVTKKQSVVVPEGPEQLKQVKDVVSTDEKKSSLHQYRANIVLSRYQYDGDYKCEGKDDENDKHKKGSGKTFGFLPHLCVKKSLCVLNPVPVMKGNLLSSKSQAKDLRRQTRKAQSGPLHQPHRDQNNRTRCHSGVLSREMLRVDSKMLPPSRFSHSNASSKSGGLSPYMNPTLQTSFSKQSSFLDTASEVDNFTSQKNCMNYKDISSIARYKQEAGLRNHIAEFGESNRRSESALAKSFIEEVRSLDTFNRLITTFPKSSVQACVSTLRAMADEMESVTSEQGIEQEVMSNEVFIDSETKDKTEHSNDANLQCPLPPPLPKSPSDSWLWQTMPNVHLRTSSFSSNHAVPFHSKKLGQKPSFCSTKWETIVKTSHLHQNNRRFSEELVRRISH